MGEAEICQSIGLVHIREENWERAAAYFKKAVHLNPNLFWSWYNLGLLYVDTEVGNSYLRKAIEVNPGYPPPYYWLAYCYCRKKKDKEAILLFKKYLQVARGNLSEVVRYGRASKILKELIMGIVGEELWRIRHLY
jgi:tetratricopeptide (TPR) repeat protein